MTIIIIVVVIVGTLILAVCAYFLWVWTSKCPGMFACSVLVLLKLLKTWVCT